MNNKRRKEGKQTHILETKQFKITKDGSAPNNENNSEVSIPMMLLGMIVVVTILKGSMTILYHSTDFDVHQHWMSLTGELHHTEWYSCETSYWTLDYPPFFAYFEYALNFIYREVAESLSFLKVTLEDLGEVLKGTGRGFGVKTDFVVSLIDTIENELLRFKSEGRSDVIEQTQFSATAVVLHRLSVIVMDIALFIGVIFFCNKKRRNEKIIISGLCFFNSALLIVDHIHFQYNGMMIGILILSIGMMERDRPYLSAMMIAILVNFKHLFLIITPVYFIYLLQTYCYSSTPTFRIKWIRIIKLVVIGGIVFGSSIWPFRDELRILLSRLFPFQRGLCHSYWAPNFWAFYIFVDKLCFFFCKRLGVVSGIGSNFTGGLVGYSENDILFTVNPSFCLFLTVLFILPKVINIKKDEFLPTIVLVSMTGFMFGYHIHEKNVLTFLLPLTLLVTKSRRYAEMHLFLGWISHCAVAPLLFTQFETLISLFLLLSFFCVEYISLKYYYLFTKNEEFSLNVWQKLYIFISLLLEIFRILGQNLSLYQRFPFLPLMMISIFHFFGLFYIWVRLYRNIHLK